MCCFRMNAPGHVLVLLTFLTSLRIVAADEATNFDRTIAPLFVQRCLSCHEGPDAKGKLDLSSRDSAMAGGESGRIIEPGDLEKSLLWQHVESDTMPPKKPLTNEEKSTLKAWITGGAKWGTEKIDPFRFTTESRAGVDWWSLKPLQSHIPPQAKLAGWSKNPVDAFVLDRLQRAGLSPSPIADKRTLIRRLSFDLLGLPPTPDEVNAFLADNTEDAWEQLVDRILASPHYGERWARHWLDVARFGESNGF